MEEKRIENRAFNDAARFLAGMPSVPGSGFAELEKTDAFKKYSAEMSAVWEKAEKRRVVPVREFQTRELGGAAAKSDFVFYPFSGPDVVFVQGFYPNGSVYVLAGLERPGTVQDPSGFQSANLEAQLSGVRRGSASLFDRSFFITKEMSSQLRGQLVDGVLPVILMLLARTGNTIDNIRHVTIEDSGKLAELPGAQAKPGPKPDGIEVLFRKGDEKKQRKLYYFRVDLGPGLEKNPSFLTFVDSLGKPEVLLKSASFLLHWDTFAKLRGYLLANSRQVIQDDTGIRFGVYKKEGWKIQLYGKYSRPDKPFVNRFQPDLNAAFEVPDAAKPLGFSMGYGTGRRPSHIIIARRP